PEEAHRRLDTLVRAPELVVLARIGVHRLVRAAVDGPVSLIVSDEVHASERDAPGDGRLPDPGGDERSAPLDLTDGTDVDGQHAWRRRRRATHRRTSVPTG